MKKNIVLIIGLIFLFVPSIFAQQDFDALRKQMEQDFDAFKAKSEQEFKDFRAEANAEFAKFMSQAWEEFSTFQGIPAPKATEPVKQPTVEPGKKPTSDPIAFDTVVPASKPTPRPQPVSPINTTPVIVVVPASKPTTPSTSPVVDVPTPAPAPVPTPAPTPASVPEPAKSGFSFLFYNTACNVRLDNSLRFSLHDISEKSVADEWKKLSGKQSDALIYDCLSLRDQLNLSDWGYMQLLKTISENFFGKDSNEAVLLQMFILTQSGYKVRIARGENRLALLVPFQQTIYDYVYLNISGKKFYLMDKSLKGKSLAVFNHEFPKEQHFTWQTGMPKLAVKLNEPKKFSSARYSEIQAMIQTNQNLIDYYEDYPLSSEFDLYSFTGLSENVKESLYPVLQRAVAGKSKPEAAGMLLNFLQTTFKYETDAKQFGYERPFFADESFFFPANNCKDRAVVYAVLVKDILDLDVVLLLYPGHLANAVHFPEDVSGDYLTIEGKKFLVCDPTYVGASIGTAMPSFKNTQAKVIKL